MIEQVTEVSFLESSFQIGPHSIQDKSKAALLEYLRSSMNEVVESDLIYVGSTPVVWSTPSLGIDDGHYYPQVLTPGFILEFRYQNKIYFVHTNATGSRIAIP